jgi:hypothetical protein
MKKKFIFLENEIPEIKELDVNSLEFNLSYLLDQYIVPVSENKLKKPFGLYVYKSSTNKTEGYGKFNRKNSSLIFKERRSKSRVNMVSFVFTPDDNHREKDLHKNLISYLGEIYKNISGRELIHFTPNKFSGTTWFRVDGFRALQEKYQEIPLVLEISKEMFQEVEAGMLKKDESSLKNLAIKISKYVPYFKAICLSKDFEKDILGYCEMKNLIRFNKK